MVSFAEEEEREEKKIRVVRIDGAASNPVEERISKMEESMAETKKQLEQILKLMQTQNQNQNQRKSYANPNQNKGYANSPRRPGTPVRCYRCHELGHSFRECKSPRSHSSSSGPQQVEATQQKQQLKRLRAERWPSCPALSPLTVCFSFVASTCCGPGDGEWKHIIHLIPLTALWKHIFPPH